MNAAAADQMNSNNGGENILLQVRAHFFTSAESVLSSLQLHTEATLPFIESFAHGRATLRPPAYVTPQLTRFDLSYLVKQDILVLLFPFVVSFCLYVCLLD